MAPLAAWEASPVVDAFPLELRVQPLRVVALHMHVHRRVVANEGNAVGLPEVHLRETDKHDGRSLTDSAGFLTD